MAEDTQTTETASEEKEPAKIRFDKAIKSQGNTIMFVYAMIIVMTILAAWAIVVVTNSSVLYMTTLGIGMITAVTTMLYLQANTSTMQTIMDKLEEIAPTPNNEEGSGTDNVLT